MVETSGRTPSPFGIVLASQVSLPLSGDGDSARTAPQPRLEPIDHKMPWKCRRSALAGFWFPLLVGSWGE